MKSYPLALDLWDDTSAIIIRSISGTRIATFPLEFVQRGGDNTWGFVLQVVQELVESDTGSLGVLKDTDGMSLDPSEAPWAGTFRFENIGQCS
jgi:hypothetical protein